jgi:hypothetical protein
VASKRGRRRRECQRKLPYEAEWRALAARARLMKRNPTLAELQPYRCTFGDHWHLGRRPYRVRQAIAAKRAARG